MHTFLSSSHLGKDVEGARLGGAGPGVPVLRVLNQALLAGITHEGRVIFRPGNRFPVQSGKLLNGICRITTLCFLQVNVISTAQVVC